LKAFSKWFFAYYMENKWCLKKYINFF
jgi:hypothetical protein